MKIKGHFILEDFFDDNIDNTNELSELTDNDDNYEPEELSSEEIKESSKMILEIHFLGNLKYSVRQFLDFLKSMYQDCFKIFYYEGGVIKGTMERPCYIYYTLKDSVNTNIFYNFSKSLINFLFRINEFQTDMYNNYANTDKKKILNMTVSKENGQKKISPELIIAGNFFMNGIFDQYADRFGTKKIIKDLVNFNYFYIFDCDFYEIRDILKNNGNAIYGFVLLFPHSTNQMNSYVEYTFNKYSVISGLKLDIDKNKNFDRIEYTFNVDKNDSYDYSKEDFEESLKSPGYTRMLVPPDIRERNPQGKPIMSVWHFKPFYAHYTGGYREIIVPAMAVTLYI